MRSRDFSRRRQPRALCQGRNQLRPSVEPVSYTHLDVYKRQTLYSGPCITPIDAALILNDQSIFFYRKYTLKSR